MIDSAEVREVALTALGRISVDLFQAGAPQLPVGAPGRREPTFDWLRTRSGALIGYGELAERMAAAVDAELDDRGALRAELREVAAGFFAVPVLPPPATHAVIVYEGGVLDWERARVDLVGSLEDCLLVQTRLYPAVCRVVVFGAVGS